MHISLALSHTHAHFSLSHTHTHGRWLPPTAGSWSSPSTTFSRCVQNPTPYILHPTPYTLHHKPCILHPTLLTLNPESLNWIVFPERRRTVPIFSDRREAFQSNSYQIASRGSADTVHYSHISQSGEKLGGLSVVDRKLHRREDHQPSPVH